MGKKLLKNRPLVTVAIPLYRGEFIRQAIDSVLSQSFKDFELLVVDDASDDKSREIVLSSLNFPSQLGKKVCNGLRLFGFLLTSSTMTDGTP